MLERIREFIGVERAWYVFVTVAFCYAVVVTWTSDFLLCLIVVFVYAAYDEKRNELSSHKKSCLNKAYAEG